MKFPFIHHYVGLALLTCFTAATHATFIAGDGTEYTLNGNVVQTNESVEWLQWTDTVNCSILAVADSSSSCFRDGWSVASNVQMAELFSDFFSSVAWDTNENTSQTLSLSWTSAENDNNMKLFVDLFGDTAAQCAADGTCSITWDLDDPLERTSAWFGLDIDDDDRINFALVRDDLTTTDDRMLSAIALLDSDIAQDDTANIFTGVALLRTVTDVPEPASFLLLSAGLLGLGLQRRGRL